MTLELKSWTRKAFELLFHAESHLRGGSDYDKRLSLISFDNSIEVSISIYLSLNPIQRGNRHYPTEDVKKWLNNYHTRLEFFSEEIGRRGLPERKDTPSIVWLHEQRNDLYHGSSGGVPEMQTLQEIRYTAIWIFSVLFERTDIESLLNDALEAKEIIEPIIPNEYTKPKMADLSIPAINSEQTSAIMIASIAGKWDEGNSADMEIIRRLANGF